MTTTLIILGSVVVLVWVSRHVEISRMQREDVFLRADPQVTPPVPAPMISVLIPARNEAHNIARTLESLLSQNYPRLEIIVADDRSEDDTAAIVRDFAARDTRIRLVEYRDLPEGWTGKNHVLWQVSQEAQGEILLFLDADVALDPGAIPVMLSHVLEHQLDALSMLLRLDSAGFWEKATQVLLGGMLMLRFPLKKVNNPKSSRAFANGQVVMMRAQGYRAIGGHESVRSTLLDDMALARRIKQHGLRLTVAYGFDMASTRMYRSLADLWRGWSRIFCGSLRGSLVMLFFAMTMLLIFTLSPYVVLASSGLGLLLSTIEGGTLAVFLLSVLELAVMLSVVYRLHRMSRCEEVYVALNPVSGLIALGILASAVVKRLSSRGIVWKGTRYDARAGTA